MRLLLARALSSIWSRCPDSPARGVNLTGAQRCRALVDDMVEVVAEPARSRLYPGVQVGVGAGVRLGVRCGVRWCAHQQEHVDRMAQGASPGLRFQASQLLAN